MRIGIVKSAFLAGLSLLSFGCHQRTVGELRTHFASEKYERSVSSHGYTVHVRFVPKLAQVLANPGLDTALPITSRRRDSLERTRSASGAMFILSVEMDSAGPGRNDFLFARGGGRGSIEKGINDLTEGLHKLCWLESDSKRYYPIQTAFENNWGITHDIRVNLLFGQEAENALLIQKSFSIVLDDFVPGQVRTRLDWHFKNGQHNEIL